VRAKSSWNYGDHGGVQAAAELEAAVLVAAERQTSISVAGSGAIEPTPTTDLDAMLYRKGPGMEDKFYFIGHALMENRDGLFVDSPFTKDSGHAERLAALESGIVNLMTPGSAKLSCTFHE
jgi:hypothetical protein